MKSHFKLSRQQRSGILFFLLIVFLAEILLLIVVPNLGSDDVDNFEIEPQTLARFEKEMDSLQRLEIEKGKPKIIPFNPNFITDHKGYILGMSNEEIDRLLAYRKQDKWINSVQDFQKVTLISDSLLGVISPYFKFPDWVTNPRPNNPSYNYQKAEKSDNEKLDLNLASADQLERVYGIGPALSKRILEKRNELSGFASMIELSEIYGLTDEVIVNVSKHFEVKSPRPIMKVNLNAATRDDLVKIKYIDYEIAFRIIEERTLRNGFNSLDELDKVKGFPVNKIEIIKLYLQLE